jgi:hypothetical protein
MAKSVFLKEAGDTPKHRVWAFLIVHSEYDYSMKDIARYSGIGYTTLKVIWKDFMGKKIIMQTRQVGRAKMFRLNMANPVVQRFIDYYMAVVDSVVRRENKFGDKAAEERHSADYSSSLNALPASAKSF